MRSIFAFVFAFGLALSAEAQSKFPPLPPYKDDPSYGAGIQRTMALLATSTPQKRNKVRILFYGQSITEQDWWKIVADDLRKRFPNADLEITNRAVGGFASQILVRTAEADLYPYAPDLLIFHVYGANNTYEDIIRNARTRTTTEILMQKDHANAWPAEKPDEKGDKGLWWDYMMNQVLLPEIAKKYGCGLADVRGPWVDYLKAQKLEPKALLRDGVHLNDHGCFVMAEIVKRYLIHKPALLTDEDKKAVRTLQVGKDVKLTGGMLKLDFEGSRVDLIAGKGGGAASTITIDGKKPSELPQYAVFTRTSNSQSGWGPALLRVSSEKPAVVEDWTLKVSSVDEAAMTFKFTVTGSKTGEDGEGTSAEKFVSKSGRVVIEPGDWWMKNILEMTKVKVPQGFEVKWKAVPQGTDSYSPGKPDEATTLIQDLPNGKHTLEISGGAGIAAIRIHRPPVAVPPPAPPK